MKEYKKLFMVAVVLGVFGLLFISGIPYIYEQSINDYGTGLNIDTSTNYVENKRSYTPKKGAIITGEPVSNTVGGVVVDRELFIKNKYICSWMPDEYSELISLRGEFEFYAQIQSEWFGLCKYDTNFFSYYYFVVDYIPPSGEPIRIIDMKDGVDESGKMWNTNYVEMVTGRFPPDSRHGDGRGYEIPNIEYRTNNEIGRYSWFVLGTSHKTILTDDIQFYMKGLRIGALKATLYLEVWQVDDSPLIGYDYHKTVMEICSDETYLASGGGSINILSKNIIPGHPLQEVEQAENQNSEGEVSAGAYYTKFVYDEGSTVEIEVNTGYSGTSLMPGEDGYGAGWTLAIYDGNGIQRKEWTNIPDNLRGKIVSYTIPVGSFNPGGNNEWRVVLKNTLFDQAQIRLFVVDSLEKIPGITKLSVGRTQYEEGDTVTVTMTADANPAGTGEISYFILLAKYGNEDSMITLSHQKIPAQHQGGLSYTSSVTLNLPHRPETKDNLYLRAHAMDKFGRAGAEGTLNVYVEQKTSTARSEEYLPQVSNDNLILALAGIILIVIMLLVVLYKQGKLSFLKGGGKK